MILKPRLYVGNVSSAAGTPPTELGLYSVSLRNDSAGTNCWAWIYDQDPAAAGAGILAQLVDIVRCRFSDQGVTVGPERWGPQGLRFTTGIWVGLSSTGNAYTANPAAAQMSFTLVVIPGT